MARSLQEVTRDRREVEARLRSMREEIATLTTTRDSGEWDDGQSERLNRVESGVARAAERREALLDEERAALGEWAEAHPDSCESGDGARMTAPEARDRQPTDDRRVSALRVIERSKFLSAPAADNLDRLVRDVEHDPQALAAQYVDAVSDPLYASAFWRSLRSPSTAHLDMTPAELRSFQRVRQVQELRSMALGSDPDGGYAVPFQLDPTILLTSDGVVNPLRRLARVVSIVGKEWQGVTSDGVVVNRGDEGDEADDASPSLVQPTVRANRVTGFIPFSVELGQDWGSLQAEMGRLLADAKDVEEADSFTNGDGSGSNAGGVIGTLDPSSVVQTVGAGSFAVGDVYALVEALPPRYQPRANVLSALSVANVMRRMVGGGSTTEMPVVNETLDRLLGRPLSQNSAMDPSTSVGSNVLLIGDFSNFLIADRLGMSIELIPHLFGSSGRPTGQRGLYAIWRNNSVVLNANAFRLLRVKAA